MVITSDKGTEEEPNKPLEQPGDTSAEKQEEDHQETKITQKELLRLYAPFPQRLKGGVEKRIYSKFLDIFASLHVNIPFIKTLQQMPSYIKYMKELLTRKSSLKGGQIIVMNKECSALIQLDLPTKRTDPGSFHIPCAIGETMFDKGLCDLGASINLMPLSLTKKLQINELMPTDIVIKLADKTQKQAVGVVENVLVKVGKYFLPTDFVILEIEESHLHPIILGRPFLATARALIDVERGELILRIHDEQLAFNILKPSQEADQKSKEPRGEHDKALLEETSIEAQAVHLGIPLQKENQEEPKPPESYETSNKISLEKEVTKSRAIVKETKKKAPRRWRNKKIPTEDFSPGDKVISAYFPVIPSHLSTISSQLPKVFTINRILSLEHVEILDEASGDRFTARGEDLKHYQPP
ncbi:hypothetical protein Ahy_B03g064876 [Arachis hypogaea]|uniref:Aspartic peptidase DDI1-type domain-containing protein n=1 Tax=Arachis hypogaea TaxID=3818 RepID=A0A445A0H2_ARAHY|nr:hypothetical protein Ahy_B03g064876 [Arachis hypogaea]